MNTFLFVFVFSLVISTTFILLIVYSKFGAKLAAQRERSLRDAHKKTVPRFGGIGIAMGFLLTIALAYYLIGSVPNSPLNPLSTTVEGPWLIFLCGGIGIFLLGLADDLWDIRVRYKLLGQIGVAIFFAGFGMSLEKIDLPVYGIWELGSLAFPVTVLWIVGLMNALNLIDGLDGLASGIAMIALGFFIAIAFPEGQWTVIAFCVALIGSILGFWLFNKNPASIFMGDSGSLFLGYCLATLPIWGLANKETGAISLLPVVILAVPIMDTLFAFFRRYLKGIPFYSADRDHIHHRLLALGYSASGAVWRLYLLAFAFGIVALAGFWFPKFYLMVCLGAMLLAYGALLFSEYEEIRKPFTMMKAKATLKKKRSFVHALSEHIDIFFQKDTNQEDLLKSFAFWASQMKISFYSIEIQQNVLVNYQESVPLPKDTYRQLVYEQGTMRITLNFRADELDVDSDVKGQDIDRVIQELIHNIYRFYGEAPSSENEAPPPLQRRETTLKAERVETLEYN